jgi:hypothetical protein
MTRNLIHVLIQLLSFRKVSIKRPELLSTKSYHAQVSILYTHKQTRYITHTHIFIMQFATCETLESSSAESILSQCMDEENLIDPFFSSLFEFDAACGEPATSSASSIPQLTVIEEQTSFPNTKHHVTIHQEKPIHIVEDPTTTIAAVPLADANTYQMMDDREPYFYTMDDMRAYYLSVIRHLTQDNELLRRENQTQQQTVASLLQSMQYHPACNNFLPSSDIAAGSSSEAIQTTIVHTAGYCPSIHPTANKCHVNNSIKQESPDSSPITHYRPLKRRRSSTMIEVENSHAKAIHNYDKYVHKFTFK